MPIYSFVWDLFAWSVTVAVLWPLMFPWLVVAYKIWHGRAPIEEEMAEEMWSRSWRASALVTIAAVVFLGLDYGLVDWTDMPAGPVHVVFYLSFLALTAGIMYYCFFMEDFFQGLSLAVIYLYIPATLLFLIWLAIHRFWTFKYGLFSYIESWLKDPTAP